jgi:hypothetical protein
MPIKNSNETIGNQTRNIPVCSAVPQPTVPPRTPIIIDISFYFFKEIVRKTVKNRFCLHEISHMSYFHVTTMLQLLTHKMIFHT